MVAAKTTEAVRLFQRGRICLKASVYFKYFLYCKLCDAFFCLTTYILGSSILFYQLLQLHSNNDNNNNNENNNNNNNNNKQTRKLFFHSQRKAYCNFLNLIRQSIQ